MSGNRQALGRAILEATSGYPLTQVTSKALAMEVLRLQTILAEVQSWIVCAAITDAVDLMQNAPRICEITAPGYEGEGDHA